MTKLKKGLYLLIKNLKQKQILVYWRKASFEKLVKIKKKSLLEYEKNIFCEVAKQKPVKSFLTSKLFNFFELSVFCLTKNTRGPSK